MSLQVARAAQVVWVAVLPLSVKLVLVVVSVLVLALVALVASAWVVLSEGPTVLVLAVSVVVRAQAWKAVQSAWDRVFYQSRLHHPVGQF